MTGGGTSVQPPPPPQKPVAAAVAAAAAGGVVVAASFVDSANVRRWLLPNHPHQLTLLNDFKVGLRLG